MSTLMVEVCEVRQVLPHTNADALELLEIKGWQTVAKKGSYKQGDKVIFFPPDALFTKELATKLGVAPYLGSVRYDENRLKVKAIRLRGEPSYGLVESAANLGLDHLDVGVDVKEVLDITKWEPPLVSQQGNAANDIPNFHKYTDIENINNYPDILNGADYVIITEKIHGQNLRYGKVKVPGEDGTPVYEYMAGSHNVRRKESEGCRYWSLHKQGEKYTNLVDFLVSEFDSDVVLFGEWIGENSQDMTYGIIGRNEVHLFDISVGGKYLDHTAFVKYCNDFDVKTVNILYEGYYCFDKVKELTDGPTTLCDPDKAGKFKGREGVVIKPVEEMHNKKIGRVILKSISCDFLNRKNPTDSH
jgi:RNA ligase (TIGR02306 family)